MKTTTKPETRPTSFSHATHIYLILWLAHCCLQNEDIWGELTADETETFIDRLDDLENLCMPPCFKLKPKLVLQELEAICRALTMKPQSEAMQ